MTQSLSGLFVWMKWNSFFYWMHSVNALPAHHETWFRTQIRVEKKWIYIFMMKFLYLWALWWMILQCFLGFPINTVGNEWHFLSETTLFGKIKRRKIIWDVFDASALLNSHSEMTFSKENSNKREKLFTFSRRMLI